jgi:hypothetical protein
MRAPEARRRRSVLIEFPHRSGRIIQHLSRVPSTPSSCSDRAVVLRFGDAAQKCQGGRTPGVNFIDMHPSFVNTYRAELNIYFWRRRARFSSSQKITGCQKNNIMARHNK